MQVIITEIALDFQKARYDNIVPLTRSDSGGKAIIAELYSAGQRVQIDSTSDTATLMAATDHAQVVTSQSCTIVDNKVVIDVTSALTSCSGIVHCVLRIVSGNGTAHSARFDIYVHSLPTDSLPTVVVTEQLTDLISQLQSTVDSYEGAFTEIDSEIEALWEAVDQGGGQSYITSAALGYSQGTRDAQTGVSASIPEE